ncbi:uncharacterized protein LOC129327679 [Eublepharis macularius]|uniref:Uncharacterized protein LOC129327679 n=1 Tax=Eublepharis macularius TaxID=481883 RepID=A0AA97J7A7_EUBMA|nr:uncharacterized protein LOC129327679 [Eublepharis macularius]
MAAKLQGTRKTRRPKKKKPQKKHQQARKKGRRLQPKKQKRRQANKVGSRTVLSISSPRLFAAKILRNMPKVRMETKARGLMKTLLMDVYDHMSKEMESLSQNNQESTVSPTDVQAFLKEAMAKELAKHSAEPASSEAVAAA